MCIRDRYELTDDLFALSKEALKTKGISNFLVTSFNFLATFKAISSSSKTFSPAIIDIGDELEKLMFLIFINFIYLPLADNLELTIDALIKDANKGCGLKGLDLSSG